MEKTKFSLSKFLKNQELLVYVFNWNNIIKLKDEKKYT
jgi:hypothetical protein